MLDEGLIVELDERPDPDQDDERRRYYRLTRFGREVAQAEADRLTTLLRQARAVGLTAKTQHVMTRHTPGERWYRRLLRLYPRDFRDEFGGEMTQLYRDRGREEPWWSLWSSLVVDLVRTAPSEHLSDAEAGSSPRRCAACAGHRSSRPPQF